MLSPEKRQLLELLRRQPREAAARPAPAAAAAAAAEPGPASAPFCMLSDADRARVPPEVEDAYPLSQLQLGMVYHMQLTLGDPVPAYHNVNSFHLAGPFDAAAFRAAVDRVVRRHPMLRTAFDLTTYGEPLQLVHRQAVMPVRVVDLRRVPQAARLRELAAFHRAEDRRVFQLSVPPLMRLHVHRFGDAEYHVTMTEMHAISEGWSTATTLSEIYRDYLQLQAGRRPPEAPPPGYLYRDFIRLERQALQSSACREFWRGRLAEITVPRLPPRWPPAAAAPRQAGHAAADRKPMRPVAPAVVAGLHRLAARTGTPIKSVLLAAHLKVLSMLAGQVDLLTGVQSHGRPEHVDADQAIGVFINYLPFRFRFGAAAWSDVVRQVFAAEVETMPYRRYPLAAMQREWGSAPLLETAFAYLNFHNVERLMRGGQGQISGRYATDRSVTHFALHVTFHVREGTDELLLLLEYDDARLSAAQIEEVRGCLLAVLSDMAAHPDRHHERRSFLPTLAGGPAAAGRADVAGAALCSLPELFAAQVARTPEAVALVCAGERLTYRQLQRRVRRAAAALAARGVGPEVLVGVFAERSLELVVGLLAVLEAGGAYVPLDPGYPEERLAWLIEDSGLALVLTQDHLVARLAGRTRGNVPAMILDASPDAAPDAAPDAPPDAASGDQPAAARCPAGPGNAAYVIYTSGSTGRPKGVVVTHGNVARLLAVTRAMFGFSAADVWTLFHSFAFDFSVWELWGALAFGGRLVVPSHQATRSPVELHQLLAAEGVTVLNQTPSAFRTLDWAEESGAARGALALRWVIFGGEALDLSSLSAWCDRHGDERPRLVNMYGITETTVHVTARTLARSDLRGDAGSLIGEPLPDLRIQLLDRWGHEVPPGVPGEIHVGGAGLARGYLHRPDLSAERFVPDPAGEPGARLYRSGDLARRRGDGELEYLGRVDNQIKLRGFRIELGEIESALADMPGVAQCVVLAREDQPGDVRLAAYLVARPGEALDPSQLRDGLRRRLPEYMVPASWTVLAALPRTAHGKLDRRALPAPQAVRPQAAAPVGPRDVVEAAVVETLQQVLRVDGVGVHDNFFDLGGNSLLLLQVHALLERRLGRSLELTALLANPTARRLAEHLSGAAAVAAAGPPGGSAGERREAAAAQGRRRRLARAAAPAGSAGSAGLGSRAPLVEAAVTESTDD